MKITLRGLAVVTASALIVTMVASGTASALYVEVPKAAWSVVLGAIAALPTLTGALMLADLIRQRRIHAMRLSMVPVVLAGVCAVVMLWCVVYMVTLPKEEGVAIGLIVPFLVVPPMLFTASLVHWSASRILDTSPRSRLT